MAAIFCQPNRHSPGNPVKPADHRTTARERVSFASKDQKCGLSRILRGVMVVKNPPTNSLNKPGVTPDEQLERCFVWIVANRASRSASAGPVGSSPAATRRDNRG